MRAGSKFDVSNWSKELHEAVNWFIVTHDIPLFGVNENPEQTWSTSPKVYANLYIDDAVIGCPLAYNDDISDRPFVYWPAVEAMMDRIDRGEKLLGHTDLTGVV